MLHAPELRVSSLLFAVHAIVDVVYLRRGHHLFQVHFPLLLIRHRVAVLPEQTQFGRPPRTVSHVALESIG